MREAINFTFDGISSEDMGVHIASPSSGLFNDIFLPARSIIEVKIPNRHIPYFQGVELEPLSFNLTFFIHEWEQRDNLREIAKWLFQDFYKPLTFETNPDRIFYAMVEGDSSLIHNGMKQGYIELKIRCNSPFTYSSVQEFEGSMTKLSNKLNVYTDSDMNVKPRMWITKRGTNGGVTIKNESTDQIFTMSNLLVDEEVFIDFENLEIVSSLESEGVYRYDNHNDVWLELRNGENLLTVTGTCDVQVEFQMIYLAD